MPDTLREALLEHYRTQPTRLCVRYEAAGAFAELTYGDLIEQGSRVGASCRALGAEVGDIVVIILPHDAGLFSAWAGTVLAGLVPTILAGPSFKLNADHYLQELQALLVRIRAKVLVTARSVVEHLGISPGALEATAILLADEIDGADASIPDAKVTSSDVALLQHSSGSTGLKKGVALSHAAILEQVHEYSRSLELTEGDRIASWLPLYHDMGLIACTVVPLVLGIPTYTISPLHWVTRPASLLKTISDHKCTLVWMPNFAYDFLAARVRRSQLEGIRLESVRGWINCAEPTAAASHRHFLSAFGGLGVTEPSLLTCYAMAETTFAVTQSTRANPPRVERVSRYLFQAERAAMLTDAEPDSLELMSGGPPIGRTEVRIVGDGGEDLAERRVGEIAIKSPSLFTGYFRDAAATAAVLNDGWYLSGDLGYVAEGHLFITGRKKDLIIIAGKNYYPQDIERIVSSVPGIYPGRVVALGMDDPAIGTQRLIVLAEIAPGTEADAPTLATSVRQSLAGELDCVIDDLRLVPHMWLLKTSSGKIARAPNLKKYSEELLAGGDAPVEGRPDAGQGPNS